MATPKTYIRSNYIDTFLPIHELERVKPLARDGVAPVQADDLFLMSQLSAYATGNRNAVMVSKSISYQDISEKISSDLSIGPIKDDISKLSSDLDSLSAGTYLSIAGLCSTVNLSVSTLSTYTNTICSDLSTCVCANYVHNYIQLCNLISATNDLSNPAWFADQVQLSNGHLEVKSWKSVSSLIVPKDWRIVNGGIRADCYDVTTYGDKDEDDYDLAGDYNIEYTVSTDCYLNIQLSAIEDDSYGPLDIVISSYTPYGSSGSWNSYVLKTFNNPGGFSGKNFTNYYQFDVPIKSYFLNASDDNFKTKVIIRYQNRSNKFKAGSRCEISEFWFYAMPGKDDLSGCVKKTGESLPTYPTDGVCQIGFNEDGLITSATSVYYGVATDKLCGLVKLGSFQPHNYALKLSTNNEAYVNIPPATDSEFGTMKYCPDSTTTVNHTHNFGDVSYSSSIQHFLSCGLQRNSLSQALTFIPVARDDGFGVVKLSSNQYVYTYTDPVSKAVSYLTSDSNPALSAYIGADADGRAYVSIPYAGFDSSGKGIPGVVKVNGTPDTTKIRVIRNVYADDKGYACVNVANQIGVGMFAQKQNDIVGQLDTGYTTSAVVELGNGSTESMQLTSFDGAAVDSSAYGSYTFTTTQKVNGWFMAAVVYAGAGSNGASESQYDDDTFLQVICDGAPVTTIRPKCVYGAPNKPFIYSTYIGVFGDGEDASEVTFGAVSNSESINDGNDKLYFLIKEMNFE